VPAAGHLGLARRALRTLVVGFVLGSVFSLAFGRGYWETMTYVLGITMFCWLFIDGGRDLAVRWQRRAAGAASSEPAKEWPGWGVMVTILVVGTPAGFSLGNALGNLITGRNVPGLFSAGPREALAIVLLSALPGIAATYFFFSRGRLAAAEATAQKAQREATETRLRLLESQLEPHMLFNTLANLRVLIGSDPKRAQAMLDQLIAFLRATLDASRRPMHSLAEEFTRVADYLALMQVRMGPRLQSRLDLPPALAGARVPPLLLQPLVENCIKHGLEPQLGGGRIDVTAVAEGRALLLRVRDTGAGLPAGPGTSAQFGLQQVRDRLHTLFGADAALELRAATDAEGGTVATVRLPLKLPA
jgi:hypothetical protein